MSGVVNLPAELARMRARGIVTATLFHRRPLTVLREVAEGRRQLVVTRKGLPVALLVPLASEADDMVPPKEKFE